MATGAGWTSPSGDDSGGRRADWLDKTAELLLPNIDYFQVVCTLPEAPWALMLGNRRATYRLLLHAAWDALREVVREELGCEPAALMVLHIPASDEKEPLEHPPVRVGFELRSDLPGVAIQGIGTKTCGVCRETESSGQSLVRIGFRRLGRESMFATAAVVW